MAGHDRRVIARVVHRGRKYERCRRVADGRVERLTPDGALAPRVLAERLRPETVLVGDAAEVYGDVLGGRAIVRPFATAADANGKQNRTVISLKEIESGKHPDTPIKANDINNVPRRIF